MRDIMWIVRLWAGAIVLANQCLGDQGVERAIREKYLLHLRVDPVYAERGRLQADEWKELLEEAETLNDETYRQAVLKELGGSVLRAASVEDLRGLFQRLRVSDSLRSYLEFRVASRSERRRVFVEAIRHGEARWHLGEPEYVMLVWKDAAILALRDEMDDLLPEIQQRVKSSLGPKASGEWMQLLDVELPLAQARQGGNAAEGYVTLLEGLWADQSNVWFAGLARDMVTTRVCEWLVRNGRRELAGRLEHLWSVVRVRVAPAADEASAWRDTARVGKGVVSLLGAARTLSEKPVDDKVWRTWFPVSAAEARLLIRRGGVDEKTLQRIEVPGGPSR